MRYMKTDRAFLKFQIISERAFIVFECLLQIISLTVTWSSHSEER